MRVESHRLIRPADDFVAAFPGLDFRNAFDLRTDADGLLITDPIYLADVYNAQDELSREVRERGVFVMGFGGDVRCPVWGLPDHVVLPIARYHANETNEPDGDVTVLAESVFCDSGSFVFLPLDDWLSQALQRVIRSVASEGQGAILQIPPGAWEVLYEQLDYAEDGYPNLHRNVVLRAVRAGATPRARREGLPGQGG